MLFSKLLIPTLKEAPQEAEIVSHKLMLRAGMIRKVASGIYTWLPLGLKVLKKIENIVISGGGLTLFTYYGILKESSKSNVWNINDIKTIYGTSAGAILSVLLCLKYDWETLDNYIINRPWEKVFNVDMYLLFETITSSISKSRSILSSSPSFFLLTLSNHSSLT